MKKVAFYIRVSTEEQARVQDGSLVSQRARLKEYVDGQNRRDPNWGVMAGIYVAVRAVGPTAGSDSRIPIAR